MKEEFFKIFNGKRSKVEIFTFVKSSTNNFSPVETEFFKQDMGDALRDWKRSEAIKRNWRIYQTELNVGGWEERVAILMSGPTFHMPTDKEITDVQTPAGYEFCERMIRNDCSFDKAKGDIPDSSRPLPTVNDNEREHKYFGRAVAVRYITLTNDGYRWHNIGQRGGKAQLAYFIERLYCPTNTEQVPESAINKLFGVDRIGKAIGQNADTKHPDKQKWRADIDNKIFYD